MEVFLDQDDDFHWYIIPEKYRKEWDEWKAWGNWEEAPDFAVMTNNTPRDYTFILEE